MNKHLRIFLCSVISVLMIFALAIAGCTTTTTTSTSSDSSTTVSDSTGTESTGSDSTGSGDSTTGDSSGSGDSSETHVHDYDYANYELVLSDDMSEATVIVPCTGCDESLTVTASITSEVKTAATNLAKGVTTYTASFTLDGVDYTIPVDVDTPALATVYDAYYINNVESSLADIELFDGFATATGGYWYNNANVTMDDCAIADGYVFQGRLYLSNGKSLTFTLEEDATVTIYALLSYNGNTVIVDEAETEVYSFVSTTTDYNDVKALEMDLDAGTYTISNEKGNTTIYAFMLQDSGKTSVYTEGLWQPAAEEEPDEPVTPDEPIDEDVSSVPETLTLGDNEVTISSTDSNGDGVSSTFTAEEDGTYTFAISANENGYVMINNSYRLSASGTTSCNIELSAEQSVTVTFWTDDYATATYTLNISSAAVASGTFELETETDYTFTAPIAGTYTFTLSDGDTSTAVIYAGKASYDAYGSALLDVQEDGTSFTYDLAEGETLTLYLAGSDGVTVSYTTGSATSGGDEGGSGTVTETVIPTLAAGDNAISVTASDAATLGGTSSDGYVKYYGASATYTAPENGYYTFSIGASDEYAYVFVVYPDGYYKLSSNSTTTADVYANGIYLTGGTTVTVYFSTDNGSGSFIAASYTFTISYVAGTSSLVIPSELTIGGTADVVMDQDTRLDVSATTVESGTYTIYLSYYDDLSAVSITYIIDGTYYYPTASDDYTIAIDLMAGKEISVYAYFTTDSSATAAFGITITYVAKEVETYELTVSAYVNGITSLSVYDDSAENVTIKEGKSIYLNGYTANVPTGNYNFTLTISSLDNLTIYASDDVNTSDTTMAADGSYDMEILASYFTKNEDGTYSYSWTLQRKTYAFFKITASADVTIDVAIAYGGEGGTLGGGSTGGDEDTHTYTELAKDVTTDITWDGESSAYVVYYSYTSTAAGTGTLTLTSNHAWADPTSTMGAMMYSTFVTMFTVTVNGETITGSDLVYTFDIVADTNYIVVTFSGSSSMVTGYTYTALLTVEETEVDPTEGYTELTANKTTEITWDGESSAYTVSYYYSASEATTATLTLGSNHAWADPTSTMGAMMYSTFTEMFTVTVNGETVTGSDLVYTLSLTEGYNYIVISFTGSSSMVDGYTYTVNLAITDTSHVHSYTIENWTWNDDYSATLDSLECDGCDEVITVNGTATVTSEVTQVASCDTHGEKVYTATYTYDGVTYTTIKTVSTDYAHSLTYYEYKAPTASENGHLEYWYCSECGKYFSDAEGDTEVEYSELVLTYNTSKTLYDMSESGLSSGTIAVDTTIFDTFTVVNSSLSYKNSGITTSTGYGLDSSVDESYTDDNSATLDLTTAIYGFTYNKVLSFTLKQSAKVTVWYGVNNANSNFYITTAYGSAANVTDNAVATFTKNANAGTNPQYYITQSTVTLEAGTYYFAASISAAYSNYSYLYAIAIDYDLSGVTISGETEVTAGNSITLTAAATLADGSASSEAIVWTTSDSSIATVDNGVVTGVAAGTVTITATAGNVSASCTITVTAPVTVTAVTVTGDTTVTVGDTLTLTYTVTMSDSSTFTGTVTWATSDSSIATVVDGVVTAIAAGEVTITATADGVEGTITITVEKAPAAAMVAGVEYSVDLTTTDYYVYTTITIETEGYYTVTVSDNASISVYDDDGNYYYNSRNCTLGYIIDNTASDEVAIKVAAGTTLTVFISLLDYDTAATVTATIAIDANYDEGGSSATYDYTLTSDGLTASLEAGASMWVPATYTIYVSEAGTYTFTVDADGDITVEVNGGDSTSVYDGGSENFTVAVGDVITVSSYAATALTVTVYTESGSDTPATTTTIYNVSDVATAEETFSSDTTVFSDDILTLTVIAGTYNGYTSIANTNTDLVVPEGVDVTGYAIHLYNVDSGATLTLKTDATLTFYYCTGSTAAIFYIVDSSNNTVYTITPETAAGYGLTATVTLDAGTYTLKASTTGRGAYINIWSIVAEYTATSSGDEGGNTVELDETLTLSDSATYTVSIEEAGTYIIVFEGVTASESDLSFTVGETSYTYNDVKNSANGKDSYIVFTIGSEDVGDIEINFALYGSSATYSATISKLTANAAGTAISLTEDAQVVAVNLDTATTYQLTIALAEDETASLATLIDDGTFTFEFSIGYAYYGYYDLALSNDGTYAYFTFTVSEDYIGVYAIEFSLYSYTGTLNYTVTFSVYQESTGDDDTSYTAMEFASETDVTSGWAYWNDQYWCGSSVTVSEAKYATNEDGTYTVIFAISSAENSSCTYGFQLFYNDTTNYTVGSTYTLTATITSDIDATVTFNDVEYTLTAGVAQDISVEFTYTGNTGLSLFDFQYAISGAITANVTISNIKWTAATSGDDSGSTTVTGVNVAMDADAMASAAGLSTTATSVSETTAVYTGTDGTKIAFTSGVGVDSSTSTYSYGDVSCDYRIKTNGTGSTSKNSVQIYLVAGATITVYAKSGSSSADRTLNLLDEDGNTVSAGSADASGSTYTAITYTVTTSGTYYLASANSGINIIYISIDYGTAAE